MTKRLVIVRCLDCPACYLNTQSTPYLYSCSLMEPYREDREISNALGPPPTLCPLLKEPIQLELHPEVSNQLSWTKAWDTAYEAEQEALRNTDILI